MTRRRALGAGLLCVLLLIALAWTSATKDLPGAQCMT